MSGRRHRLAAAGCAAVVGWTGPAAAASPGPAAAVPVRGLVRVDQAGYAPAEPKTAYVLATGTAPRISFAVRATGGRTVLRGTAGADRGSWNARYPAVYPLDLSRLRAAGRYRVVLTGGARGSSPWFPVAARSRLLSPLLGDAVSFFTAQRDGADVPPGALHRRPAHRHDARTWVYAHPHYTEPGSDQIADADLRRIGGPVDVEGGWFDAGDFLHFTHTTAYALDDLLVAARDLGPAAPAALAPEIRFGLRWLAKTWRPAHDTMVIQVGIGSGNAAGTFAGDHDSWRLPQVDDHLVGPADRYLRRRPVFVTDAAPGRLAPNLAGRVSAAFALAAQVDASGHPARARRELATAAAIFDRARTTGVRPRDVVTALPHAFYPETAWRDDLELGAAELARAGRALGDPRTGRWLRAGRHWARAYLAAEAGGDTLNLYDVSALAHAELLTAGGLPAGLRAALLADLRRQLAVGAGRAAADPFGAGGDQDAFDVASHTFGLTATAQLYDRVTGSRRYAGFADAQRGWVFGANPWGVSMMIGAGTTFPHCPQHVVANLSGSLDGRGPVLRGAVVNGPNGVQQFAGGLGGFFAAARTCPADRTDRYARFTGHGSRFVDDVRAWQTDEPAIDFTGSAVLALALQRG